MRTTWKALRDCDGKWRAVVTVTERNGTTRDEMEYQRFATRAAVGRFIQKAEYAAAECCADGFVRPRGM